jgi:hypothetical protein
MEAVSESAISLTLRARAPANPNFLCSARLWSNTRCALSHYLTPPSANVSSKYSLDASEPPLFLGYVRIMLKCRAFLQLHHVCLFFIHLLVPTLTDILP